ncbi:related to carotenoid cleavage dioxygenase 1 [Melanopsichium pennsylvanicum]|uniref:Related to carotenoid cleavage dioxygenase 1 n=2 Tax=Melanopsichium pennsylvanicum TaxID=63383 RepID=A0AAJ4XH19_9BASI|nr:related to carotenoid cleavage dioxygenase 1 [Melanopsichium pennsylvanicum 4]SNX82340.1 related to carotenoid cleavage dioxygenase 1 [Melanopsichium pennsylvanicum]
MVTELGSLKRPTVQQPTAPAILFHRPPATAEECANSPSASSTYLLIDQEENQAGSSRSAALASDIPRRPVLSRRKTSKKEYVHPYLSGNFAPVTTEVPLTDCLFDGTIPEELAGSQYVRNGGNPLANSELDRDAHWFDADGMLAGVLFRRTPEGTIQPCFLNRFILTDLLLSTPEHSRLPYLPSIATLVNPHTSVLWLMFEIIRTFVLTILTWLPGLGLTSGQKLRRISVANTSVFWHDGKAMAGCESGPPMRIMLPGLETAGWYTGGEDEKPDCGEKGEDDAAARKEAQRGFGGGPPIISMLREFTTAHPKIDPKTQELLLYHMCFEPPYLRISVIPPSRSKRSALTLHARTLKGRAVRGLKQPKMMHDFGATSTHTVIIDVPLSLDMMNLVRGKPILHYDPTQPSRFGVMPRYEPGRVRWFESPEACCVYHTANSWDDDGKSASVDEASESTRGINMLGCRLNSATLVYSAGNLLPPSHVLPAPNCPEKCQLYYWRFDLEDSKINTISHEFALSDVPFEFPTINEEYSMQKARYVYGTSMRDGTFDAGLGKAAKIDALVKIDAEWLIRKGKAMWSQGRLAAQETVDSRTVEEILAAQRDGTADEADAIKIFEMPRGWYAQETTFVARRSGTQEEDDGWLVCYVFDEAAGLHPSTGEVLPGATSELWIIDAKRMKDVVCRIKLPQRVPYGLHGTLFTEQQIAEQKPVDPNRVRSWALSINHADPFSSSSLGSTMCCASGKAATSKFQKGKEVYAAFLKDPIRIGAWWIKRKVEQLIA